jgi:AcrR family transcriptional regulator
MTVVITVAQPGRRERLKAVVRARIIETAIDLFAARGLQAVTVDEIATRADVGKGTIYNYFQTKEEIVVAFMVEFERKVQDRVRGLDLSRPLADVLVEFLRLQFKMKKPRHAFVRVFLGQMFLRTAEFLPHMAAIHKASLPPVETLFRELQRRGVVRADVEVPDLVSAFVTLHLGLTALWAVEGPPFRLADRAIVREVKFFCEGVEATR